ncbi:MAG: type II CAAX prenyl endopeptidase Rce1 family protein [Candidatus Limnocylindrales bacterium]
MDTLRALVAFGLVLLLVMQRLDAERLGAAEYDEARDGKWPSLRRRLAWYLVGLGLIAAVAIIYPTPSDLYLSLGDRPTALLYGFVYGAIGVAQAVAFAMLRYHHLRFPDIREYPGSILNAIATAFIDEATFRGLLLAFLVLGGIDPTVANVIQALTYTLATRVGAPGRDRYMLVLVLLIGLGSGWVTLKTGAIGAAFLGHAVTRVAVFLATGHAGQVALRGKESEDIEKKRRIPEGWRIVGGRGPAGNDR